jgi:stage II sporulation protein D
MPAGRGGAARAARPILSIIAAALLFACSGVPPRGPAEEPPAPSSVPGSPPPGEAAPRPSEAAGSRFLRVRVDGGQPLIALEAGTVRAWDAGGRLVAEASGTVSLGAIGDRVRFNGTKLLGSDVDVAGFPELRLDGKSVGSRLRIVARNGRVMAVAVVPLETYVAAVISRETPPLFHPEALKAQAVATRTYAVGALRKPRDPSFDVVGSVEDQVFEGHGDVEEVFRAAARETRGLVLLYDGAPARTVFHSTCGGRTESAANAWGGKDIPYLGSRSCGDCQGSPVYRWEYRMTMAEGRRVARALGIPADGELRFSVASRTSTGRAARMSILSGGVERECQASEFRRAAGYARVRSLWMTIDRNGDGWIVSGRGYGHGVGMCQYGANGMARSGSGYREILERYYPGTVLAREDS